MIVRNPETAPGPVALHLRETALEGTIRNLYVQSLKAKLELCRIVSARLMEEAESQELPARKQRESFCRWFDVTRDGDILEFVFELLRRHEREARATQSFKKSQQRFVEHAEPVHAVRCRESASSF
jgi:hypothetical protein